mmetsp:Transcript_3966/g.7075  ORF Transcript_3966/g.7075 Transcript_3966/m.7075 type:complete len:759 (-) Transcript_3966:320-2596(-)
MKRSLQISQALVCTSWLWLAVCSCLCKLHPAERASKDHAPARHVAAAWSVTDEAETTQCAPDSSGKDEDPGMWAQRSEIGDSLLQVTYGQRHRNLVEARRVWDDTGTLPEETPETQSDGLAANAEEVDKIGGQRNHWAGVQPAVNAEAERMKQMEDISEQFQLALQNEQQHIEENTPVSREGVDKIGRNSNPWAGVQPVVKGAEERMKKMEEINEQFKMALQNEQQHIEALQEELAQEEGKVAPQFPRIKDFTIDKTLSLMEIRRSSIVRVAAQIKDGSDPHLTVAFHHKGKQYAYTLFPESVYTEAARIYDGDRLMPVEAARTFQLRDKGRWASITWHHGGGVQGILEANGYFMKIAPVSRQAPQVVKAVEALLLQRHDNSHEAHLIRWVARSEFFQRSNRSHTFASQRHLPKVPYNEASHLPDAHGRDPWVEEQSNVASVQGWGGVRWHPGCYRGDAVTHEMLLGFVSDKAARDLFGSADELQRNLEVALHEASFIFQMQMNIKLKLNYLKMSNDEAEFDACKKKRGQFKDKNYGIAIQKLELMRQLTRDGTIPWHAANHFFTGCADGSSGTVGLAYEGTGCQCCHNVGVTLIPPHAQFQAWDTFAHELGHNFNGSHSFEEGQGNTGGIMDYGDGKLDGHYQFNSKYRKTDMCGHLDKFGPQCKDKTGTSMFHPLPPTTVPAQAGFYTARVGAAAVTVILILLLCLGLAFQTTTRVKGSKQANVRGLRDKTPLSRTSDSVSQASLVEAEHCACFPC